MLDDFSKQNHERAGKRPPGEILVLPSLLEGAAAMAPAPAVIR